MSEPARIVMFSGGIGSWAAAKRVAERHGTDNLTLLFTDTLIEDADLHRFLDEAAADVGGKLVRITEGRSPWQVFRDEGMIANTRADLCSRILKREPADAWLAEHCDPGNTTVYIGIDWTEVHRFDNGEGRGARNRYARLGWRCEAPLCEPPYLTKQDLFIALRAAGIRRPRLYDEGFAHNNCGGFCVKAGLGQFAHLLKMRPALYAEHEQAENEVRATTGWRQTILRDSTGGTVKPVTLTAFRERIERGWQPDLFDIGGCGCFVEDAP